MKIKVLFIALSLGLGAASTSALEERKFDTPVHEQRYRALIEQLRCLVCQNQSLADSDADLAGDLRDQVYTMIRSGADDRKIIDYMTARYGDFVLYRPPLKATTVLLWAGPFIFAAGGLIWLITILRRRRQGSAPTLSVSDRARLRTFLGPTNGDTP